MMSAPQGRAEKRALRDGIHRSFGLSHTNLSIHFRALVAVERLKPRGRGAYPHHADEGNLISHVCQLAYLILAASSLGVATQCKASKKTSGFLIIHHQLITKEGSYIPAARAMQRETICIQRTKKSKLMNPVLLMRTRDLANPFT